MPVHQKTACCALALSLPVLSWAQDKPGIHEDDYLVGASVVSSTAHIGTGERKVSLKPVWYFQLGPVRVSRSQGSTLLGAGRRSGETGLSAELLAAQDWNIGVSLRMDNGRTFDEEPLFIGLPDIKTTVRARVSARRPVGDRWSWNVNMDQDILGKDGGMRAGAGVNYRYPVSDATHLDLGLSAGWADAKYMRTHFGISPAAAQLVGRAPYSLGSGLEGVQMGIKFTTAVNRRWVVFGGVDLSRLQGDAARSPLVGRPITHTVNIGVAYRNMKQ
ncbi:MAG: MipA/OmpV family protein [Hydrogenophaga sp.]|nr:MipA/OmpV family protein [Hydrogenophaga sp.]